jgi:hypothetical protein
MCGENKRHTNAQRPLTDRSPTEVSIPPLRVKTNKSRDLPESPETRTNFLPMPWEPYKRYRLEAGIDRLAFEGQHAEDAFVDPAEGLLADKSFKGFNPKSKLAECQRALG